MTIENPMKGEAPLMKPGTGSTNLLVLTYEHVLYLNFFSNHRPMTTQTFSHSHNKIQQVVMKPNAQVQRRLVPHVEEEDNPPARPQPLREDKP